MPATLGKTLPVEVELVGLIDELEGPVIRRLFREGDGQLRIGLCQEVLAASSLFPDFLRQGGRLAEAFQAETVLF